MRLINRLFLALLSCALSVGVFAQTQDSTVVAAKDSVAPKKTKVFLEHANTLSFDKERNAEAQVLNGDVCFRHDSSYMYCDSAYFFSRPIPWKRLVMSGWNKGIPCSCMEITCFTMEIPRSLICGRMSAWRMGRLPCLRIA